MTGKEIHSPRKTVKHYDQPGDTRFLTFSCYQRMPLLSKERTQRWTIEAIQSAREKHGFELWAWVVMPEHVHLLVRPADSRPAVTPILQCIKVTVANKAIRYLKASAPAFLKRLEIPTPNGVRHRFWQAGPGFDSNLSDAAAVHEVANYIHHNPVKRGLSSTPEEWEWSSAADWKNIRSTGLLVDRTMPTWHSVTE